MREPTVGICAFADELQLSIIIDSDVEFERALRQAALSTEWLFDPIRFWVRDQYEHNLVAVDVHPDEIVFHDVTSDAAKYMSVELPLGKSGQQSVDAALMGGSDNRRIGKVRSPAGFKLFSVEQSKSKACAIHKYLSDSHMVPYMRVESSFSVLLTMVACCGGSFDRNMYLVHNVGTGANAPPMATVLSCTK